MAESDSPPVLPEDDLPIRLVLLDVNGTLLDEQGKLFPETRTALQTLRKHVPAVRFLSNDSDIGASSQLQRLRAAGLEIADNEFVSSLTLAKTFVKLHKLRPLLLLSAAAATDFACVDQKQPNCVIVGDSPEHFSYEKLNEAFRVIASSSAPNALIAVENEPTKVCKKEKCLSTGAFVAALESATGKQAYIIGKPSRTFWNDAVQSATIIRDGRSNITGFDQVLMIGDDPVNDVKAAMDRRMNGILVQTGVYRSTDDALCLPHQPYIARCIETAVSKVVSLNDDS